MTAEKSEIATNFERLQEQIKRAAERAGRHAEEVTIVAVSKTFPFDAIRAAYDAGLRHFGENRVQEWETKQAHVADLRATWHLIGHLQGNKARRAANLFDRVDSVDSLALAQKLDAAFVAESGVSDAETKSVVSRNRLQVLIEVKSGDEATKSGVQESDLPGLAESRCKIHAFGIAGVDDHSTFFGRSGTAAAVFFQAARASRRFSSPFEFTAAGALDGHEPRLRNRHRRRCHRNPDRHRPIRRTSGENVIEIVDRNGAITITVRVIPRASRDAIEGAYGEALKVRLTGPRAGKSCERSVAALAG